MKRKRKRKRRKKKKRDKNNLLGSVPLHSGRSSAFDGIQSIIEHGWWYNFFSKKFSFGGRIAHLRGSVFFRLLKKRFLIFLNFKKKKKKKIGILSG